jgi:hypothetical protein
VQIAFCAQLQHAVQCERNERAHVKEGIGTQVLELSRQRARLQLLVEEKERMLLDLRRCWRQGIAF